MTILESFKEAEIRQIERKYALLTHTSSDPNPDFTCKSIYGIVPLNQTKMAERIIAALLNYISSANLEPGCKLPSEKELGEILQVGNQSLRQALMILQTLGLAQSQHGAGWFVKKFDPTSSLQILSPVFEKFGGNNIFQILDTRLTIEPQIACLAAEHISGKGLAELSQAMQQLHILGTRIQEMQEYDEDYINYGRCDQMFHNILAQECKNNILAMLNAILSKTFDTVRFRIFIVRIEEPLHQHQAIYNAVSRHDSRAAEEAMRLHIEDTRQLFRNHRHLLQ